MNAVAQAPRVWHFLSCDRIDRQGGGPYSLTRVRLEIPNPLARPVPRVYSELFLYLALSDGTGVHTFQVHQTCLRDQTHVVRWPAFTADLGDDPTAILEHAVRLDNVIFWANGQCEFHLYSGGRRLATAVIDVR